MIAASDDAPARRRILQVVWGLEEFGGLEHHLTELALALSNRGDDVLVFAETALGTGNAYVRRLRAAGICTTGAGRLAGVAEWLGRLPLGPLWRVAARLLETKHSLRARVSKTRDSVRGDDHILASRGYHPVTANLFKRLDAAVAERMPDVVHVHGTRLRQHWAVAWAAAYGIPSVYTEHITLHEWNGVADPASLEVIRSCLGALACVSERSRNSLIDAIGDDIPIAVVRHVVAANDEPAAIDADGPLRLLVVARLELIKGIDVLLRAMSIVRASGHAVHLTIAGDGSQRRALHDLARKLGLVDIDFLGAVAPEGVPPLLNAAHVLVLSSRGEGLPVALVEAMAHGRAAIATRSGGVAEVVQDGMTGILVDPERADQLAEAISRLASDRSVVKVMGEAARQAWRTGGWTPEAVLAETDALYRAARMRTAEMAVRA